jgi:lipopolysaccharide export system permease protein
VSRTLLLYVVRLYLRFVLGIGSTVVAIYLVTDFVDRARDYQGPHWIRDAAELYAFKSLVIGHQLAPAVLLLSAAATVTTLRKRGELTAIQALAFGPRALYVPIGGAALGAALLLVVFDETVVVHAVKRSEQLTAERFHRWGEWRLHFTPKRWFRHDDRIFYLRSGDAETGFENVTIFSFDSDFRLRERLDAQRMDALPGKAWRLQGVVERSFAPDGSTRVRRVAEGNYPLGVARSAFRVQLGRPEQMHARQLLQQIHTRSQAGLATRPFELVLHNRFAYPLMALPAALLALGLVSRLGWRGQLSAALVQGMGLTLLVWAMLVLGRAMVQAERLSPATAAWGPSVLLGIFAFYLWTRREGVWGPRSGPQSAHLKKAP